MICFFFIQISKQICFFYRYQNSSLLYEDHERCLQQNRNHGVPKAPETVDEIREAISRSEIYDLYCKTDHQDGREIFLDHLYEGKDFSYCIFSSKKIIQHIEATTQPNERRYLIDGTFKVVPFGSFKQLLIIHFARFGTVYPFIYVLMSNRTQIAYSHVLKHIDKHIFSLQCASFHSDYETAMKNALRACFPQSQLLSCWFHFVQAIRKNVSKMGLLFHLIRTNSDAAKLYYKFQALALLRADLIPNAFNDLKRIGLTMNKAAFQPFVSYFEKQWIKKVCIFT